MVTFIDQHRDEYGVEPICAVLPIAPSTYFLHQAQQQDPTTPVGAGAAGRRAARRRFSGSWDENEQVYGPRKVWKQLRREGIRVARCTVERLMREMGLRGAVRGRAWVVTTQRRRGRARPADLVDRQFTATRPNQLWVADFTYVATWRGFVYVAFVIDVFARRIVGWRVSRRRCAPISCSMRWSRRSTIAAAPSVADWCITAIAARSTCRCATPSGWLKRASRRPSAAAAIRTTTPWPNRSSASSRPR